jgi:hypothetical protein
MDEKQGRSSQSTWHLGRVLTVKLLLIIFALIGPWAAPRAYASTITVNSTDLAVVQSDGKCTLIEAMENARNANGGWVDCTAGSPASNIIELQAGQTYTLTGAWTNAGNPAALGLPIVTRTLTINGHGSTLTRGLNAGSFRVLYVYATSLSLNDLTIKDIVLPSGADGAVYNDNGTLNINRSTLKGTRVEAGGSGGGAITSRACSTAVLASCPATSQASLNLTDSAVDDNESLSASSAFGAGAGVNTYAVGSGAINTTTIVRSRFHANTATNQGAAVSNSAYDAGATSTTTIDRSSITANTTTGGTTPAFGGGIANFVGKVYTNGAANAVATMNITNTTIASNTAANSAAGDGYGGGIFNEVDCGFQASCGGGAAAHLTLRTVTMSGNTAGRDPGGLGRGGGIWSNDNDPMGSVDLTVRDLLMAGNVANGTAANCRLINTTLAPHGYNIASDSSCGASFNLFTDALINLAPLNFASFTYYQTPQSGSAAIDKTTCIVAEDQIGTARPIGLACDVGAIEANALGRRVNSDFNGDGRSDAGIFRPSVTPNALWYSTPSGGGEVFQIYFGTSGDIPVPADYDGDGKTDAVIWRPSTALWYGPRTGAGSIVIQLVMGQNGDIPVPCDYDGDGAIDPAIYRPSTGLWFGTRANGGTVVLNTNISVAAGDIPVPADFNGDGKCDPAIMRPGGGPGGTNLWYSVPSGGGTVFQIYFGAVGDIPVPGDYDGDGKGDAVIFRPSTGLWYGPRTGAAQIVTQVILGQNGDIPVPGDYDGNGATDPAIYRPGTGLFYGTNAAGNTVVLNTNLGLAASDIPTAQRPHEQAVYPYVFTPLTSANVPTDVTTGLMSTVVTADVTTRPAPEIAAQSPGSTLARQELSPVMARATPASGSGTSRLFTFTVSARNGSAGISAIHTIINSTLSGAGSCLVVYDPAAKTLQLADDAGTRWSSPLAVGGAGTITNSQCAVHAVGSSVSAVANTLTLVIPVTFDPSFAGPKTIYGLALNADGDSSGWQSLGTWTVPSARAPSVSLTPPLTSSGLAQTFAFTASAPNGSAGISAIHTIINSALSGAGSCFVAYDPAANTLQLGDNTGTRWSSPVVVGGAGTITNSQCAVHAVGSSVSAAANTFTLVIPVTFDPSFAGPKAIYGLALTAEGDSSGWHSLGTWTIPSAGAPSVSLTPPLSSAGLEQTFTFSASASNGPAGIIAIHTIINSTLSGVGSCLVAYDPAANTLQLGDDAGASWSSPVAVGGAGTITNSQCAVHAVGSSVSAVANTLTLVIPVTFDPSFAGPKTIYGLVLEAGGGGSNWQSLGSWTVASIVPNVIHR